MQIPTSDILTTNRLGKIFSNTVATYKFFWFVSDQEMTALFWKIWDNYPHLKEVRYWWNNLKPYFMITPVGVALANAYIRGKEPSIPSTY